MTTFKGKKIDLKGKFPALHAVVPPFHLVDSALEDKTIADFGGHKKLIATVPSIDTGVCSAMTIHLNQFAKKHPDRQILVISADLPFAQGRFCKAEGIQNIHLLSMMRDKRFGEEYGLLIATGPLAGLLARSLMVVDEHNRLLYIEVVDEITKEPDYDKALHLLRP